MNKVIIDCQNITKIYVNGDISTTALKDVSFNVREGEFIAIIGPSGSGKSTLMNIVGALDRPTRGEYYLCDKNVAKLADDELAKIRIDKIGFVFQSFNLLARATVLKNVELPLIYADVKESDREKMARQALISANIEEKLFQNKSNQLSGGQMQRVAIARALVNNPSILLADEPTGNLDQKTGKFVLETIRKLNDKGRTIILITHDQYVARHADRIIQISDGRIVSDTPNSHHIVEKLDIDKSELR